MEFTNSKGVRYYLYRKHFQFGRNKIWKFNYFFSREPEKLPHELCFELPIGFKVFETHTGMPVLKKL